VPKVCSKTALAPYIHGVRAAAASVLADLQKAGGTSPLSRIVIMVNSGEHLVFSLTGGHFRVSGTELPAACSNVAQDDWTG
jgi:hypothetical protein